MRTILPVLDVNIGVWHAKYDITADSVALLHYEGK